MKFQKGQSGNPKGRPKRDAELQALMRAQTPRAQKRLLELMDDESGKVAVAAIKLILEYGWGKPRQSLEVTTDGHLQLRTADSRSNAADAILDRCRQLLSKPG